MSEEDLKKELHGKVIDALPEVGQQNWRKTLLDAMDPLIAEIASLRAEVWALQQNAKLVSRERLS